MYHDGIAIPMFAVTGLTGLEYLLQNRYQVDFACTHTRRATPISHALSLDYSQAWSQQVPNLTSKNKQNLHEAQGKTTFA